jgi:hypothetical protein
MGKWTIFCTNVEKLDLYTVLIHPCADAKKARHHAGQKNGIRRT